MCLLSFFKKNMQKQGSPDDVDSGEFRSRAEEGSKLTRGEAKRTATNRKAKVVDPILPEKKRARRRLIGAVALALAAVIGLPMVLDSEPKQNPDDISIQIPSKDKPLALLDHNNALPETTAIAVASKYKTMDTEPVEEIISPALKASPIVVEKPIQPIVKPDIYADAKPDQRHQTNSTEPASDSKSAAPSSVKASAKTSVVVVKEETATKAQHKVDAADEAFRALAILEGKTSSNTPAAKTDKADKKDKVVSGFTVQVAALATQEKVNELQSKLNAANIKSYTQKVVTVSGHIIRIRVGPFESKDEAEKMRAKLEKLGLTGKLIPQ